MVRLVCPHCRAGLSCGEGDRKVQVQITLRDKKGMLFLSAVWGDYESEAEGVEVIPGDVVEMYCPHCHESLKGDGLCRNCKATTTIFGFAGGYIGICNRTGCKMHLKSEHSNVSVEKLNRLRVQGWEGPYSPY